MNAFSSVNTIWVLLGAALVFFMQAGFAMVETGFTRAKNAGNIIMKNLMDFSIGTPAFWLVGFGLMFGTGNGIIGSISGIASESNYGAGMLPDGVPFYAFLIFQTVFCATAATIVSGAMAERTKFSAYCIYSLIISLVVYPVSGHWIWGGGWLAEMGFHDFAGSCAVHMVGGVAALVGAKILGPRIGKYSKSGKSKAIPGHNLTIGALGVFILWFAWFGFNGASTVSMEGDAIVSASKIFVTTNLAAAVATVTVMILTWILYKKPDVSMSLNGSLAGLVAITAGCDTVSPVSAAIIGILAGLVVVFGIEFIDKVCRIDDPVGAVGVHGMCGALGTLCVGLFSDGSGTEGKGLFTGGGFTQLGVQFTGFIATAAWVAVTMIIVFEIIKHTMGLRVSAEEEIAGLDIREHGLTSSYADFVTQDVMNPVPNVMGTASKTAHSASSASAAQAPAEAARSMADSAVGKNGSITNKLTKVVIITRRNKLEDFMQAMNEIGVTGITITNVLGCGVQKGSTAYYRGVEMDMNLLPKVKIEIVVSLVPVQKVIDTAKSVLHTGQIGDGKVFIYDIENVVKIRTGEQGYLALQDTSDEE
ncbi:ammonium transporter [Clostridium sp. AF19-22AC]|uniref:Nitrogen regulatory protein P-II family /ammonium transporter n=1 Tax=Faecalicatena orotica TaxID=1544 RepID=A0A2Y9CAP5_9FIRM|nr:MULTISPECIES: ammonium transporter [Clostridia]PWJ22745.1 nitrogen regulatory protein P-II family /ammonium transporter [Faecalicatena orotica]RHR22661.1 ammonium transporter [Clostridium sp. AF19-22AC]SSA58188.1 nitrogen regulatory protein P-II family /ammonium transporter [Faecalicatena orotica]